MLFMVIERFRDGNFRAVGERFRAKGRMIPDGLGLVFVSSWITPDGSTCFQLMESPDESALDRWADQWRDLVDFEYTEVQSSADFWASRAAP